MSSDTYGDRIWNCTFHHFKQIGIDAFHAGDVQMAGNTVYTTDNCSLGLNDVNGGVVQTSNFSDGGRYAAFNNTRPGNISVLNGTTGVDIHDNQVHGAENNYAVHFDSTASNNLLHNNDEWAGSLGYEGGYTGQNSVYSNIHH